MSEGITKSKAGRPPTGCPKWNPARQVWEARVMIDGKRKPIAMRGIPQGDVAEAKRMALVVARRVVALGVVPADSPETVNQWFGRYFTWRMGRARGAESIEDSRGRFNKWISPHIGTTAMVHVTREQLEEFVSFLDDQVADEVIAAKTAQNIWGEVSAAFNVATQGKDTSLRVLDSNPAEHVARPDDGVTKQKPFLRPDEIVRLLACAEVPLERRYVYAVAAYTALRQGELRALRVGDIDLDAMQISVVRQAKNGKEKQRTKTSRARIVQIEPNLVPLLRAMMKGKESTDRLLFVGAHNRCAAHLREDLLAAGCAREALHVPKSDPMRIHMKFHNLRDTCLTHMAVRRDAPQDVQWRAGHTTPAMTEAYISNARYQAGANFGTPLPPLPAELLKSFGSNCGVLDHDQPKKPEKNGGGAGNRTRVRKHLSHASTCVSGSLNRFRSRLPASSPESYPPV
jgi:integrase